MRKFEKETNEYVLSRLNDGSDKYIVTRKNDGLVSDLFGNNYAASLSGLSDDGFDINCEMLFEGSK